MEVETSAVWREKEKVWNTIQELNIEMEDEDQMVIAFEKALEQFEILSVHSTRDPLVAFSDELYAIYLLCYLRLNHLDKARHLWKRMPSNMKTPIVQSVWKIGQSLWTRNVQEAYTSLDQPSWPETLKPWIVQVRTSIQNRMATLIAEGYECLLLENAASALGLSSSDETRAFCQMKKWNIEDTMVYPSLNLSSKKISETTERRQLQELTDYIVFLERKLTYSKSGKTSESTGDQINTSEENEEKMSS